MVRTIKKELEPLVKGNSQPVSGRKQREEAARKKEEERKGKSEPLVWQPDPGSGWSEALYFDVLL